MITNSKLGEQLISLNRQKFTGILTITAQNDLKKWEMFFHQGEYLWTEGGYHANRSWHRNFNRYCPGVDQETIVLRHQPEMRSLNYCLLNILLQRQAIERKQAQALIENRSQEILFDLWQKEYHDNLKFNLENVSAHYLLKSGLSLSLVSANFEQKLLKSKTEWTNWGSKGLASCSPHHAPLLHRERDLQQLLPDMIFTNMSRLLNGKQTLRDLAVRMDKNVLEVTCGIIPYFFKGYLRLLEIADLPTSPSQEKKTLMKTKDV